jgi:LysR family glycine cleavage system transcriptional activator
MVPVCAPTIAPRMRRLGDVDQGQIVQVLGFQDHWARLYGAEGLAYDPARAGLAVDTTLAAVEIVTTGAGVALLQRRLVQGLVTEGRLAVPFVAEVPLEQAHYLVSVPGAAPNTEADAFRAWLRGEFGEAAA